MSRVQHQSFGVSLLFLAAGCGAAAMQSSSGASSPGSFEFIEHVPGTSLILEGTVSVHGDTIALRSTHSPCYREA